MYPVYNRKITLNIKMNEKKHETNWLSNAMIYSPSLSISLDVHWVWINWQRHCAFQFHCWEFEWILNSMNKLTMICQLQQWLSIWRLNCLIMHVSIFIERWGVFDIWIWGKIFIPYWENCSKLKWEHNR